MNESQEVLLALIALMDQKAIKEGRRLPVKVDNYVVGSVELSTNKDPKGRHEEEVMFGMFAVEECLEQYCPVEQDGDLSEGSLKLIPMPRQQRFLLVVKAIAKALRGGKRDEALEQDISAAAIKHYGTGIFSDLPPVYFLPSNKEEAQ